METLLGIGDELKAAEGRQAQGLGALRPVSGAPNGFLADQEPSLRHAHWDQRDVEFDGSAAGSPSDFPQPVFRRLPFGVTVDEENIASIQLQRCLHPLSKPDNGHPEPAEVRDQAAKSPVVERNDLAQRPIDDRRQAAVARTIPE